LPRKQSREKWDIHLKSDISSLLKNVIILNPGSDRSNTVNDFVINTSTATYVKRTGEKNMIPSDIDKAATLLANARRDNQIVAEIPQAIRPQTLAEAYAIQERLIELLDVKTDGWFCACTNEKVQSMLGLYEPYYARLLEGFVFKSGTTFKAADHPPIVLECEFGFRLNRDLPSRQEPYSQAEVESAVLTVHPTIEVVMGHLKDWPTQDVFSVIADNGTDGALVYGEGVQDWQSLNLKGTRVNLKINDEIVRSGLGADVLGDPVNALVWLANARSKAGDGLKKEEIYNTGTATDIFWVKANDKATAEFSEWGAVSVIIE
jgi:2-keto-4-pentenoate hydratase